MPDRIKLNLNEIIEPIEKLHGKDCKKNNYDLFYDETNNFRKLWIKNGRINEEKYNTFILGGIGVDGDNDHSNLFDGLKINVAEVKFKTLAKGSFQDILKSENLGSFIDATLKSNYFIHYMAVDIMYYSLVDIIDSLITQDELTQRYFTIIFELKSYLYQNLMNRKNDLHELLVRYEYPDINSENSMSYLQELKSLITLDKSPISIIIHSLIEKALSAQEFVLLDHEDKNILLPDFHQFYLGVICNNVESNHQLDKEVSIQSILNDYELIYNNSEISNVSFVDSKTDVRIQYSDIWVGVLSRYFDFVKENSIENMKIIINDFNPFQRKMINDINAMLKKSLDKDMHLLHQVMPLYVLRRRDWLLELTLQ